MRAVEDQKQIFVIYREEVQMLARDIWNREPHEFEMRQATKCIEFGICETYNVILVSAIEEAFKP